MKTTEAYFGAAAFAGIWLLMSFAALTPVEVVPVQAQPAAVATLANCADGSAELVMGCASSHL